MPPTADSALAVAQAIEGARTMGAVQDRVRDFAAPLGYDRFVLFAASAVRDDIVEKIYWVEGRWFDDGAEVDAATYVRKCPVTRHVLDAREPFFWTKTTRGAAERYRVVRVPRGGGMHGIQVPVFGPAGLEGAMSLGGARIDASARARLGLAAVAAAAFATSRRLLEPPAAEVARRLTDREREVLAWTAAGRRQAAIAATLGLSERTVENHLRRIRKRLGATTTAQALRIAIRNGEIVQ